MCKQCANIWTDSRCDGQRLPQAQGRLRREQIRLHLARRLRIRRVLRGRAHWQYAKPILHTRTVLALTF